MYPPRKNCIWKILAPPKTTIFLNFTHFNLEGRNVSSRLSLVSLVGFIFCYNGNEKRCQVNLQQENNQSEYVSSLLTITNNNVRKNP
ncbi:unnamed protein product [Trichobilharzia regenti]|nr:unnamed protein product [Trichobilharzia regenti]